MSKKEEIGGLLFVACMFIGAGIGMLSGKTAEGGAIGMGVGFLLMALVKAKVAEVTPLTLQIPRTFGQICVFIIGFLLIISGIILIYYPELLYPYIVGSAIIIAGILMLLMSMLIGTSK